MFHDNSTLFNAGLSANALPRAAAPRGPAALPERLRLVRSWHWEIASANPITPSGWMEFPHNDSLRSDGQAARRACPSFNAPIDPMDVQPQSSSTRRGRDCSNTEMCLAPSSSILLPASRRMRRLGQRQRIDESVPVPSAEMLFERRSRVWRERHVLRALHNDVAPSLPKWLKPTESSPSSVKNGITLARLAPPQCVSKFSFMFKE
mmetsp:Transcript_60715/g.125054  ORF Transcript_60715/g.125054 Transcript_60715/m.125054 type:complete len:206 (-) Transcript_60715:1052-1669(-)